MNISLLMGAFLILGLSACHESPHASDSQLVEAFGKHRQDLERLVEMFHADTHNTSSFLSISMMEPSASTSRIEEYRTLFKKIGIEGGMNGYGQEDCIRFPTSTSGIAISGSAKGYEWRRQPPDIVVEDTDSYRPPKQNGFIVYKTLADHWYVFRDVSR